MTKLKLYYEGWLALPAAFRRELGLDTASVLEAELVDGAIVLRPAAGARSTGPAAEAAVPAPSERPAEPAKRPRGRPRKVPEAARAPEPASATPAGTAELAKLRRKVTLPVASHAPVAARGRRPERMAGDAGHPRDERHPFPHVEVKKLAPGRRQNRLRRLHP